jgi:hypothetical protein
VSDLRVAKIVDMLHRTANVCEDGGHKNRAKMLRALAREAMTFIAEERRIKIVARFTHVANRFEANGQKKRARMFRMLALEFEKENYQ